MGMNIILPPDLEARIEQEANARGMSLADFVRASLERVIAPNPADDPLFADTAVYHDDGPADYAANHDEYLYGNQS